MTNHFFAADPKGSALESYRVFEIALQMFLGFASGIIIGAGIIEMIWMFRLSA